MWKEFKKTPGSLDMRVLNQMIRFNQALLVINDTDHTRTLKLLFVLVEMFS